MATATLHSLSESDQALLRETARAELATLDEDQLIALVDRVRRARNKAVTVHRQQVRRRIDGYSSRGKAGAAAMRSASKAEMFEAALARTSAALARTARASAKELKAERLAAARAGSGGGLPAGPAAAAPPASRTAARKRPPIEQKVAGGQRAATARQQAARDAR